jgi:fructuronate reductase
MGAGRRRFVGDIVPFEQRKLWLLNGAHSLLAYGGLLAGYRTVSEAMRDARLRAWVDELWGEAGRALPAAGLDLPGYRDQLCRRFGNPRIEHRLPQIAADGTAKLRQRVLPVLAAALRRGDDGHAATRVVAAWVAWLLHTDEPVVDPAAARLDEARRRASLRHPERLLEVLDARLATDGRVLTQLRAALDDVVVLGRPARA